MDLIDKDYCSIYSSFIGAGKSISLHYDLPEKNRLKCILFMFSHFRHNEIDMHLLSAPTHLFCEIWVGRQL